MALRSDNMRGEHIRSVPFELRAADEDSDGLTLEGYGTTFDDFYDVEDWLGVYRERVAKGSFAKTIKERRGLIKVQYDHGHHPVLGSIPIGSLQDIREDSHGLFVSVRLHDNWMTEPVRDAIRSQAVSGMSIRFQTTKDEWKYDSDPEERTISLGVSDGTMVEVTEGLTEGERLVIGDSASAEAAQQANASERRGPPPRG